VNPDGVEKVLAGLQLVIEKTTAAVEQRKPFEDVLLDLANAGSLENFVGYIDFEKRNKPLDTFAVRALFERALKVHCLVADLWVSYTSFLDRNLQVQKVVLATYERAVRNCPWSADLWTGYLRALVFPSTPLRDTSARGY